MWTWPAIIAKKPTVQVDAAALVAPLDGCQCSHGRRKPKRRAVSVARVQSPGATARLRKYVPSGPPFLRASSATASRRGQDLRGSRTPRLPRGARAFPDVLHVWLHVDRSCELRRRGGVARPAQRHAQLAKGHIALKVGCARDGARSTASYRAGVNGLTATSAPPQRRRLHHRTCTHLCPFTGGSITGTPTTHPDNDVRPG